MTLMAVKAQASITIFYVNEVEAVYRYYLLQSSTLAKPSAPTSYPPSSSWVTTEPTYTEGSTTSLYYVDCTVLTDGSWSYSPVSLSSSYEAAKLAYNKAQAALGRITTAESDISTMNGEIALRAKQTEISTIVESINADISDVQDSVNATNEDLNNLTNEQNNTFNLLKATTEQVETINSLLLDEDGIIMEFTNIKNSVTSYNGTLNSNFEELYSYIRFTKDGEIYLGKQPEEGEDDLQLAITRTKIAFLMNGNEVAWFSNNSLYVTTVRVEEALRFGNFEFAERSNGNMGLRWVGES